MRIGIDAYPLTTKSGGIRRYAINLVRALARVGADHEYTLFRGGAAALDLVDAPANVRSRHRSRTLQPLIDHVDALGPNPAIDLYHGTNYFSPLIERVPTVVTIHDLSVQLFPDGHPLRRRIQHRLLPWMCRRAAGLIADSQSTKNDLVRRFGLDPGSIDVIHLAVGREFCGPVEGNGAPEQRGKPEAVRDRYGLPPAFFLFVGTLEPRKNLPTLIRAAARLRRGGVHVPLVLGGYGDRRYVAHLEAVCRAENLEIGREVRLLGLVPESDLATLYSLCSVFVYPSTYEGFGLPPLEAMACGAPCIVGRNSALGELYSGSAALADLDSDTALADVMGEVLENEAFRQSLVELGRKQARARSWDDVARETLDVDARAAARSSENEPSRAGSATPERATPLRQDREREEREPIQQCIRRFGQIGSKGEYHGRWQVRRDSHRLDRRNIVVAGHRECFRGALVAGRSQ
jgi:glycosyltransferase involved in cell wall biosynthesis